jgi:ubiquinone/menaquinone biosynthesis C-methylase UbiE
MVSFENSGARDAARCYRRYRPPVPRALLDDLLARTRVAPSDILLDLACGPGRVGLSLAHAFASVTAVDLEPEMIAEGEIAAAERGIRNVTWRIGRAEDVEAAPGTIRLVTIGDALHRFDQPAVLANIRSWLTPGCAIAILRSMDTLSGSEPWHHTVRDLVTGWSGCDAAKLAAPTLPPEQCEAALAAHGFRDVASFTFTTPYVWSIDAILGNLASTSYCAPHVLGPKAEGFAAAAKTALASLALTETMTFGYTFGRV